MTHYTTLSSNLKRGILSFSERISHGLTQPEFKFVSQMIYGMLAAQNCHLSKIARTLGEKISLKKTIDRLSRNLSTFTGGEKLFGSYVKKVKGSVSDKTILIIDDCDVTKPCSSKMEGLGPVMDGSTGEMGVGYHMYDVTALTPGDKAPVCVYSKVFSAAEEGFVSATCEALKALEFLRANFKKSNIRAFDRGFDANVYFNDLMDNRERFVIRVRSNRTVMYKGGGMNIMSLAGKFKGKYSLKFKRKNGKQADCKVSIVPIRLCFRPDEDLNLVICRGLGKEPLLLITNLNGDDGRLAVTITKVYLLRWRIEEFHGFKKQQFGFEDFRVRSLQSIRNLDLLLNIAIGYIGIMSERAYEKPAVMVLIHYSKRIYGIPRFKFYAIADGMFDVFAACKKGIAYMLYKPKSMQLSMFPDSRFASSA